MERPLADWRAPSAPARSWGTAGRYAALEPLQADRHVDDLFAAFTGHDRVWDYLPYGPFETKAAYLNWLREAEQNTDVLFRAVRNLQSGRVEGVASFLRIDPSAGSIEVGHLNFSPRLQRTRAATETIYMMMAWAFEAGYRRFEWKCDASNGPSRRAAQRLGLSYEGIFRQAAVVKGRNRDTAWFAAIDGEWPALRAAFQTWLDPDNFDTEGQQHVALSELTGGILVQRDPAFSPD